MTTPLTISYLTMGAQQALQEAGNNPLSKFPGGQLELIDEVTASAELVCRIGDYIGELNGHEGVWLYDVVEPFGYELAKAIMTGTHPSTSHLLADVCTIAGYDPEVLSAAFSKYWIIPDPVNITDPIQFEPNWMPFLVAVTFVAAVVGILEWLSHRVSL